jgi:hypothetical protein
VPEDLCHQGPICDSEAYDSGHRCATNGGYFTVIEPSRQVLRFCDSDCLREHYRVMWDRFKARLDAEMDEMIAEERERERQRIDAQAGSLDG